MDCQTDGRQRDVAEDVAKGDPGGRVVLLRLGAVAIRDGVMAQSGELEARTRRPEAETVARMAGGGGRLPMSTLLKLTWSRVADAARAREVRGKCEAQGARREVGDEVSGARWVVAAEGRWRAEKTRASREWRRRVSGWGGGRLRGDGGDVGDGEPPGAEVWWNCCREDAAVRLEENTRAWVLGQIGRASCRERVS
jgi:hypothetical protein